MGLPEMQETAVQYVERLERNVDSLCRECNVLRLENEGLRAANQTLRKYENRSVSLEEREQHARIRLLNAQADEQEMLNQALIREREKLSLVKRSLSDAVGAGIRS